MDEIHPTHDRDKWQAAVNMVLNLLFYRIQEISLVSTSFSRRTLLHSVSE